jgi:NAD(P)H-hydrate epimerase
MSGAACLAGKSALRSGAGLVTLAAPVGIVNIIATYEPSYMTLGLAEDDHGRIQQAAAQQLAQILPHQTAVGIGPGLSQSAALLELVAELYHTIPLPSVFDADALNLLSKRSYLLKRPANTPARIVTPHPGEFARLTGLDVATIQNDREKHASEFAKKNNVIVVLKGQDTVITDGERIAVNTTGNSGLATGGTGDVLTGVLASLLAQGMPAFEAAQFGVYLHGLAGDLAAEEFSKPGLIASDLPHFLGRAWCELEQ